MMKKTRLLLILPALLLIAGSCGSTARAFDGFHGGRGPLFGAGVWRHPALFGAYRSSSTLYSLGYVPIPPYFALQPPVYYSLPVRRPYGASPFAWRGDYLTPRPAIAPRIVRNPTIKSIGQPEPAPTPNDTAGGPKLIINPFYQPDSAPPEQLAGDGRL